MNVTSFFQMTLGSCPVKSGFDFNGRRWIVVGRDHVEQVTWVAPAGEEHNEAAFTTLSRETPVSNVALAEGKDSEASDRLVKQFLGEYLDALAYVDD